MWPISSFWYNWDESTILKVLECTFPNHLVTGFFLKPIHSRLMAKSRTSNDHVQVFMNKRFITAERAGGRKRKNVIWSEGNDVFYFILRPGFHHIDTWDMIKDEGVEWTEEAKNVYFVSQIVTAVRSFLFSRKERGSWKSTVELTVE